MTISGKFITLEGVDGAGKSTHLGFVADWLRQQGREVVVTREPGGTPLGETLRELLLHREMDADTELLLMFAARQEHLAGLIRPALARGAWVVSDRFTDASYAYQCGGRGIAAERIAALEAWVQRGFAPDLTLLFDVPPEVAEARRSAARSADRFEREADRFFSRVRNAYLDRAHAEPARIRVLDARHGIAELQVEIGQLLQDVL
ncbi:dTMP kinase [Thiobacillus denitrificans]|jgi:dTMP kinase|uniref:dTMP kinase n=1 Tax=Thiobacillus denitrificans TaxID=36861 RepID=UPI00036C32EA|nr:dTMP kinase [Thiobacillus denitrificans]